MDVSIIMINYNTLELSKVAIDSIFEYTKKNSFELILIDNASPDGSGDALKELYKDKIIYIGSDTNLGTSKAFNLCAKMAKGKYVLWLNTDIYIKHDFVGKLFDYIDSNDKCGICGGNVLDFNGNVNHSFRMEIPSLKTKRKDESLLKPIVKKLHKKSYDEYNFTGLPMKVGYITGADMMIRKSLFSEIGYFNEDIFMYAEESEFSFRALKAGYDIISVPDAVIYHLVGASCKQSVVFKESRFRIQMKSDLIYFKSCYGIREMHRFAKIKINKMNKLIFIYTLLCKKNKALEFKTKKKIINELLIEMEK